jgi:hypothetical protein
MRCNSVSAHIDVLPCRASGKFPESFRKSLYMSPVVAFRTLTFDGQLDTVVHMPAAQTEGLQIQKMALEVMSPRPCHRDTVCL